MNITLIWTKTDCRFCDLAKTMLKEKGIRFEERNISTIEWTKQDLLNQVPNAKTVPQIFLYGEYIGGYQELKRYFQNHDMWRND